MYSAPDEPHMNDESYVPLPILSCALFLAFANRRDGGHDLTPYKFAEQARALHLPWPS